MKELIFFPKVKEVMSAPGFFTLPDAFAADRGDFALSCTEAFEERMGLPAGEHVWLTLVRDETLAEEEYVLNIAENGVTVRARTERGVIYALSSLYIAAAGEKELCCCTVKDKPKYSHRGLSLDCVRHFFPADEVKRVIEQMSRVRMNVLRWRLSDDQGWRVECESFPRLNEVCPEYYTKDEIRDVVEYARVRGIDILPEIDMPGHVCAILAAYPKLGCFGNSVEIATAGGIYADILCAGKSEVYEFLERLFDEICPLFPCERFHIGGDEAPKKHWESCPDCRRAMEEYGLESANALQGLFTERVTDMLKKHGKTAICWNELLRSGRVPEGVQIHYWNVDDAKLMQEFIRRGGEFIYSDMFELYMDYPVSMTPVKRMYAMVPNVDGMPCGELANMLGIEVCVWTEYIAERRKLEERLFPRAFVAASAAWGSETEDYGSFCASLERVQRLAETSGITCVPRERWDPKGRARRRETVAYMAEINSGLSDDRRAETLESAKPGKAFIKNFMNKFFRPTDIPFLLKYLLGR